MTTETAAASLRGPTGLSERAFTPDFARGMMLLLIVLSNTSLHLQGEARDSIADSIARFAGGVFIDSRTFPLFAFLFGYGITQLANRQRRSGSSQSRVRGLLRRRGLWLFVFGLAHAALLLASEILATYGLLSLLLVGAFINRRDRTLLIAGAVGAGIIAVGYLASALPLVTGAAEVPSGPQGAGPIADLSGVGADSYPASILPRLATWGSLLLIGVLGLVMATAMLLGMWAARQRFLEEPHRHLRLLATTAIVGIGIGLTGSLPPVLSSLEAEHFMESTHGLLLFSLQWTSGLAGGLGYVGLFGLLGHWLSGRASRSASITAVTALGKRSLSGYLTHSMLMAPLLAAWGLGLGAELSIAEMMGFGFALWLLTVVIADLLERRGRRGPFEVLLRRLVYGKG